MCIEQGIIPHQNFTPKSLIMNDVVFNLGTRLYSLLKWNYELNKIIGFNDVWSIKPPTHPLDCSTQSPRHTSPQIVKEFSAEICYLPFNSDSWFWITSFPFDRSQFSFLKKILAISSVVNLLCPFPVRSAKEDNSAKRIWIIAFFECLRN